MNLRQLTEPRHVWLDGVLLALVIALLNALLAPRDIGWLELNPTPYLILPLLLGGRYGFGPGVISALLTIAGIVLTRVLLGWAGSGTDVLEAAPVTFVSLVVAGGLAGEIWLYFRRRISQFEATESVLRGKLRKMDSDVMVLREAKDELDRVTALIIVEVDVGVNETGARRVVTARKRNATVVEQSMRSGTNLRVCRYGVAGCNSLPP